jgi:hypothetical protein
MFSWIGVPDQAVSLQQFLLISRKAGALQWIKAPGRFHGHGRTFAKRGFSAGACYAMPGILTGYLFSPVPWT